MVPVPRETQKKTPVVVLAPPETTRKVSEAGKSSKLQKTSVKVESTGSSEIWKESEEAEVAKTKGKNKPPTILPEGQAGTSTGGYTKGISTKISKPCHYDHRSSPYRAVPTAKPHQTDRKCVSTDDETATPLSGHQ
jgi:hypothetical protein